MVERSNPSMKQRSRRLGNVIEEQDFGAVAIGFIHSYLNGSHEERAREILAARLPGLPISISSEVSPQMREV